MKIVLNSVTSPNNVSVINDNFRKIAVALDEQVLYRDNPGTEPNQMENDTDSNGFRIYNLPEPVADHEPMRKADAELIVTEFAQPVIDAANQATIAANNANAAAVVATEAAAEATTVSEAAELAANNAVAVANTANSNASTALAGVSAAQNSADAAQGDITAYKASVADSDGASLVGFVQIGTGASPRSVQSKAREVFSVKDFGAVGNGVALDGFSFEKAHNAAPAGQPILVPPGTYVLDYSLNCYGRVWQLEGATLTGAGTLVGAIFENHQAGGSVAFSSTDGPKWKYGQNKAGAQGIQIGGGVPQQGGQGMMIYADGYSGWTAMAPSQYPSSAELAIQPSSIAGTGTPVIGTNRFLRTSGGEFFSSLVGKRIYLGIGQIYTIASFVNSGEVTVKNLNGSAVSFVSAVPLTYIVVPSKGTGICNVNGTTVTRVSGDPFLILGNADDKMRINGVDYGYAALPSQDIMTLASSAGTQNNVPYEFWTSVDNLSSALRVHRVSAAGFEENVTLGAYADGYFHLQAAGGLNRQYPFYIGSGYDARGKRQNITMDGASGSTLIGGGYDWPTIEVEYKNQATNWWYFLAGATGGGNPRLIPRGPDSSIGLDIESKGGSSVNVNGVLHRPGAAVLVNESAKMHMSFAGGSTQYGITIRPAADGATPYAFYNAAGTVIGAIVTTSSTTAFNTSSDYRLKEYVFPMVGGLERVEKLKPCTYEWKRDGSSGEGFIAHELQEVIPLAVSGEKDGEAFQAVDYSKVVPVLTAAIQELLERVKVLEHQLKG